MKNKRFFAFAFVFLTISAFIVSAQGETFLPDIIERFLKFVFLKFPEFAKSGDDIFVIYAKFFLWLLVFPILFYGAKKVFHDETRIAGVISLVLSLITVILIPKKLLLFIFNTYSTVMAFVAALVPTFLGVWLGRSVFSGDEGWKRVFRGITYILVGVVTLALGTMALEFEGELYRKFAQWAQLGGAISIVAGIIAFFFGGEGEGGRSSMSIWPFGGGKSGVSKEEREGEEEERDEEGVTIKMTGQEIKVMRDIFRELGNLRTILERPTDYNDALINQFNARIANIETKLDEMVDLDEKIKKFATRIYKLAHQTIKRATSRRARQNMEVAREVVYEYRRINRIENMIDNIKGRLNQVRGLPSVPRPLPISNFQLLPASQEIIVLTESMNEVRDVYNRLVRLFRIERITLNEIP